MRNFLVASLCVFSLDAAAVSVAPNPLLPDGISLDFVGLGWQSTTLSDTERPNGLVGPLGVIHLGTNSDVFLSPHDPLYPYGGGDFWVRYSLDSTSHSTYDYPPDSVMNTPLSGEFWLSFKQVTSGYRVDAYLDQLDGFGFYEPLSVGTFDATHHSEQDEWQSFETPSLFFRAFTGIGATTLNLSFLKLAWDYGTNKYALETSATGFDQVFYEWASEGAYGTVSLNIAPVPLPASAMLLLSGLTSLVGARRLCKSVI